jgi:hypothetical protein
MIISLILLLKKNFSVWGLFNNVDELGMNSDMQCGPAFYSYPTAANNNCRQSFTDRKIKATSKPMRTTSCKKSYLNTPADPVKAVPPKDIHLPLDKITKGKNKKKTSIPILRRLSPAR